MRAPATRIVVSMVDNSHRHARRGFDIESDSRSLDSVASTSSPDRCLQKPERAEGPFQRFLAGDEAALCADRIGRQGQAHSGDACRRGHESVVRNQPILWIGLLPEVLEGGLLKGVQPAVVNQRGLRSCARAASSAQHASESQRDRGDRMRRQGQFESYRTVRILASDRLSRHA